MPARKVTTTRRTTHHTGAKVGTHRVANPYAKFVKAHIKTASGATQQDKMRAVAVMWKKHH